MGKEYLIDYLKFCVDRENGTFENLSTQNTINMQKNFDYCMNKYNGENVRDYFLKEELDNIKETHNNFLNKTDNEEYDKDYSVEHTKVLRFVPKNNNDNLTGLDKAAFVSVAVILEATLVGTLIIALISLVK